LFIGIPLAIYKGHDMPILSIDVDKAYVLTESQDNTAILFSIKGTVSVRYIGHKGAILSVSIGKDYVLTGSSDKVAYLWDKHKGKKVMKFGSNAPIKQVKLIETWGRGE